MSLSNSPSSDDDETEDAPVHIEHLDASASDKPSSGLEDGALTGGSEDPSGRDEELVEQSQQMSSWNGADTRDMPDGHLDTTDDASHSAGPADAEGLGASSEDGEGSPQSGHSPSADDVQPNSSPNERQLQDPTTNQGSQAISMGQLDSEEEPMEEVDPIACHAHGGSMLTNTAGAPLNGSSKVERELSPLRITSPVFPRIPVPSRVRRNGERGSAVTNV